MEKAKKISKREEVWGDYLLGIKAGLEARCPTIRLRMRLVEERGVESPWWTLEAFRPSSGKWTSWDESLGNGGRFLTESCD